MELSQTAEYALRAMAVMALVDHGAGLRARDLAETAGIPVHYLSKLMRRLVVAGLLTSQKGHGGGFVLARSPRDITFLDVLRAVERPMDPTRCAFGWGSCDPVNPCPLHPTYSKLSGAFFGWAEGATLADVDPDSSVTMPEARRARSQEANPQGIRPAAPHAARGRRRVHAAPAQVQSSVTGKRPVRGTSPRSPDST